jgi:hypothetical protein
MDTSQVFGPKHHGGSDDPFETIKVLEAWLTPDEMIGFCKGQSIVYQRRHRMKHGLEDLAKSAWYQNYLVKYLAARNLTGLGSTSVPPEKSAPSTDGGDAGAPAPAPEQAKSPLTKGSSAGSAAPAASLEDDIAAMARRLAPQSQVAA